MISKQELSLYESVFLQSFDSKLLHKMEEAEFSEACKLTNM